MPLKSETTSILLIGYGNPARADDGLGPALAGRFQQSPPDNLTIDIDYQLSVEHAEDLAAHDIVIFADAERTDQQGQAFRFEPIQAGRAASFSTHSVSPQAVLRLAKDIFQARTRAYILGITGDEFDKFDETLSDTARENLHKAELFLRRWIETTGAYSL